MGMNHVIIKLEDDSEYVTDRQDSGFRIEAAYELIGLHRRLLETNGGITVRDGAVWFPDGSQFDLNMLQAMLH